ncbi:MAG: 3-isopropylmalate dehydratase [Thermoplasmata archaeon]|nr:3-isopropylmalate dehydratase [Thermoplasmata archaeon]
MRISGKALKYGDDINTDLIYPGRYLHIYDPDAMAKHAMADLDPDFHEKFRKGDIIVAGKNFGCGSSREQAAMCLKHTGVGGIVARSFARIFFRNAINQGIPILQADTDKISWGDELEINPEEGIISNLTTGEKIKAGKLPPFLLELLNNGGLIPHLKKAIAEEKGKGKKICGTNL